MRADNDQAIQAEINRALGGAVRDDGPIVRGAAFAYASLQHAWPSRHDYPAGSLGRAICHHTIRASVRHLRTWRRLAAAKVVRCA